MKPVTVSVTVPTGREEVYDFLAVLSNHEPFVDHLMDDFQYSGPPSGVSARLTAKARAPGSNERIELEVIEAERPHRIVEESVSAGGKRRTRGTYTLAEAPGGGTEISFEFAWLQAPSLERTFSPLTRAFMRRANGRAMRGLAKQLARRGI